MDEDEENEARDKMDEVQQIVEDFHDLLVPEALEYYLGLNEDFDMLGMDGEGDGESGSDDNGDNSDDSGDKKPKKAGKKEKDQPAGEEKQECK